MERLKKIKGFTLIELVLIILIVGIISLVAVPRFNLKEAKVGTLARKIVSDLRYAQNLSITKETRHGIIFTTNSYTLFKNDNTATPARDPLKGGNFQVNMNGDFAGVSLSTGLTGGVVKFNAIGAPLDNNGVLLSSSATITIQASASSSTVTIEPNTGKISMN